MKINRSSIPKYEGDLDRLVESTGDFRYDNLSDFLSLLSHKLNRDGKVDKSRNQIKLANSLFQASEVVMAAKIEIDESWRISEPYTDDYK